MIEPAKLSGTVKVLRLPAALWVGSLLLDLCSLWLGNPFVRAAFYSVAGGVAVAIVLVAAAIFPANGERTLDAERGFALSAAVILMAADAWLRALWIDAAATPVPAVILCALGLLLAGVVVLLERPEERPPVRLVHSRPPAGVIPFPRRRSP